MEKLLKMNSIRWILCISFLIGTCIPSDGMAFSTKAFVACKLKGKAECHGKCEDGFGEDCYFDSNTHKKLRNEKAIIPFHFSPEVRNSCFVIHSVSECDECYNRFFLNEGGLFKEVSCEIFYQAIEDKNRSCNNCLEMIQAGCC